MKTTLFLVLAVAVAALTACNNGNEPVADEVPAVFATNLKGNVQTRMYDGTWEATKDAIGIFTTGNGEVDAHDATKFNKAINVKYSCSAVNVGSNATWTSTEAYRFKNPTSPDVKFKAYYPYTESTNITEVDGGKMDGTIAVDASTQSSDGQKKFDFLFADKESESIPEVESHGSKDAPEVKFQFHHSMSKVILVFKADKDKGVQFDEAFKALVPTLKGLKAEGSFSLKDGKVTASSSASTKSLVLSNSTVSTASGSESVTFIAIVPPQTAGTSTSAPEVTIKISSDNYLSAKILSGQEMKPGKSYTYTITVRKMELIVSATGITDWKADGTAGSADAIQQ